MLAITVYFIHKRDILCTFFYHFFTTGNSYHQANHEIWVQCSVERNSVTIVHVSYMFVFRKHTIDVLFFNGLYDFKYSKGYVVQNKQTSSYVHEIETSKYDGRILYY